MVRLNFVCSLLYLLLMSSTFSESCLDGTTERLISGSRYRVQDRFFKANSVDGSYIPREARLGGDSWCSSGSLTISSVRPWLQVTFTKEFNISIIQTGGFDGYNDYYLTRFKVLVGNSTQGSLRPLMPDDSTRPIVFRRRGTYLTEDTVLPSPVIARVLRIEAVSWIPSNQVCLRLEALGCLPSPVPTTTTELKTEAPTSTTQEGTPTKATSYTMQETTPTEDVSEASSMPKTTPTEEITEASSNTMQETPPTEDASSMPKTTPTEEITEASSNTMQETAPTEEISEASSYSTQDNSLTEEISEASSGTTQKTIFESSRNQSRTALMAGAVGGSLSLLLVALVLVIIVVVVIVTFRRRRCLSLHQEENLAEISSRNIDAQFQYSESHENHSEYNFDNSIYGMEMVLPSLYNDATDHRFDNSIYGVEPVLSNLYEDVAKCTSKGEFNTDYCQGTPDTDTSNTYCSIRTNTKIFHESMQDPNGTLDRHNEEMNSCCLYDKKSSEPFKMEYHKDRENIPAGLPTNTPTSTTTPISHGPVQDLNETIDPYHQQIRDNPLYGEHNT